MNVKNLKDRGIVKWNAATFMNEQKDLMKEIYVDYYKQEKPTLDDYQIEEFESKIHCAMEYNLMLEITVWCEGYEEVRKGKCHYLDHINKKIRLVGENRDVNIVEFKSIVNVKVEGD